MDRAPASVSFHPRAGDSKLARKLARQIEGEVLFDRASRGRYSTDASIYQIDPVGVVVPKTEQDAKVAMQVAVEEGVPILPRGAGSSQCGQAVVAAFVINNSKYLNRVISVERERATAVVEPGVVLDALNAQLRPHGLWFPVDVSTSSRATIGGMAANNSCGSRSIRYGNMVHNVRAIDAVLADGTALRMGEVPGNFAAGNSDHSAEPERYHDLVRKMRALHRREADEIDRRIPKLLRKVGGYNIDMISDAGHNMAHLLVGSEGTLAFFNAIELDLQPIPPHRVLGICHFPTFYKAMDATQHIVKLGPSAVELIDHTMIGLSREIAMFRATVDRFVKGEPAALQLVELMGDLGFPSAVVEATDAAFQQAVWEVRKEGLNIMMSMKGEGKPISFIEDCAVSLDNLADYT